MDRHAVQEDLEQFEEELDREDTYLPQVALEISVEELHLRNHETIGPDASIQGAIDAMLAANIGCLPVVENDRLVGIITERNILHKVAPDFERMDTRTVREVMVLEPVSVRHDASVASAIRLMHEGRFRHLPIVDAHDHVEGTLSVRNIVEYVVDHFPAEVLNLPPTPVERNPIQSREGA